MFKRVKIKVTLKSGRIIKSRCNAANVSVQNNEVIRISITEDDGRWPNYVHLDSIDTVNVDHTLYGRLVLFFNNFWIR